MSRAFITVSLLPLMVIPRDDEALAAETAASAESSFENFKNAVPLGLLFPKRNKNVNHDSTNWFHFDLVNEKGAHFVILWRTGTNDRTVPKTENLCFTSSAWISKGRLDMNNVLFKSTWTFDSEEG